MTLKKDIDWLIIKEFQGNITQQEKEVLKEWRSRAPENEKNYLLTLKILNKTPEIALYSKIDMKKNWKEINGRTKQKISFVNKMSHYWHVAAFFIILFGIGLLIKDYKKEKAGYANHLKPGESKAYLELADNKFIVLDSLVEENLKEVNGTQISIKKSVIAYNNTTVSRNLKNIYHTLRIPRGGEFELKLSDGTKVWLNAETILKYPVHFNENERTVYIEGEAYFEVHKDENHPFIVKTEQMDVNVLGTSFNIKAYNNEAMSIATLVSGKVNIKNNITNKEYILTPNEQATCFSNKTSIRTVNIDQYIAWKNGRILFEENTLDEIMSDLSRWYDIEIFYQNPGVKNLRFSIDTKKYENFEIILDMIALTKKVSFNINNNAIIVMEP